MAAGSSDRDRHRWAAELVDPAPGERLLEIGCGHGATAAAVAERLREGRLVALDRSAKMIAAARRRLAPGLEAGVVELRRERFEAAELEPSGFDALYAFHVADFWRRPEQFLPRARRTLRPGGRLLLFNQMPGWRQRGDAAGFVAEVSSVLASGGFELEPASIAPAAGRVALCLEARRAGDEPL